MSEHTKEPWRIDKYDAIIAGGETLNIGATVSIPMGSGERKDRGMANARRIVACVNACAGVETEWLERCAVGIGALFSLDYWSNQVIRLKLEKHELQSIIDEQAKRIAELEAKNNELTRGLLAGSEAFELVRTHPKEMPFAVLAITTAYEQGVGKGHQGNQHHNAYRKNTDCWHAWNYGYEEGQRQMANHEKEQSNVVKP